MDAKTIIIILLVAGIAVATDCNVPKTMATVRPSDCPGLQPGESIILEPGNRGSLTIRDFRGQEGLPIIIRSTGKVNVDAQQTWVGIWLANCEHIRLSGENSGIEVYNSANVGVSVSHRTGYVEIDNIEIHDVGGAGISAKTADVSRTEWTQYDTHIHHNYLHDIGAEAMYIGGSYWQQGQEPELKGVEISYNTIERSGYDGIQVGSAVEDVKVHHNIIIDSGLRADGGNANGRIGLVLNHGTTGDWYNNWVENSYRYGLYSNWNTARLYNNVIVNSGLSGEGSGMRLAGSMEAFSNTIVNSAEYGISGTGTVYDNIIAVYGTGADNSAENNNMASDNLNSIGFVGEDDFHLTSDSPAANAGTSTHGFDFDDKARDEDPDIGAYEYIGQTCTSLSDIINFMEQWRQGIIGIDALVAPIQEWKLGC